MILPRMCDTIHLVLITHGIYFYAVTNFSNPAALQYPTLYVDVFSSPWSLIFKGDMRFQQNDHGRACLRSDFWPRDWPVIQIGSHRHNSTVLNSTCPIMLSEFAYVIRVSVILRFDCEHALLCCHVISFADELRYIPACSGIGCGNVSLSSLTVRENLMDVLVSNGNILLAVTIVCLHINFCVYMLTSENAHMTGRNFSNGIWRVSLIKSLTGNHRWRQHTWLQALVSVSDWSIGLSPVVVICYFSSQASLL